MGGEFEHRVVTHRHGQKLGAKNCDAFPPHRRRAARRQQRLQLVIIRPKVRCFPSQLEAPSRHRRPPPPRLEKNPGLSSFYLTVASARAARDGRTVPLDGFHVVNQRPHMPRSGLGHVQFIAVPVWCKFTA